MASITFSIVILALFCLSQSGLIVNAVSNAEYTSQRNQLLRSEEKLAIGSEIVLNDDEIKVNEILMRMKQAEIEKARKPGGVSLPSVHFFKAKPYIARSKVYRMIRKMPKGGVLHIHEVAMTSISWLIRKATYREDCYMCVAADGAMHFKILNHSPSELIEGCTWKTANYHREQAKSPRKFDAYLFRQLSMVVRNPEKAYPTSDAAWRNFLAKLMAIMGLAFSEVIFKDFFLQGLSEMRSDNVQYCEIRASCSPIYALDGTKRDTEWTLKKYIEASQEFTAKYPDFLHVKIIVKSLRFLAKDVIMKEVQLATRLREEYPDYLAGYDLVAEEDTGHSLLYYIDALLWPSQNGKQLQYVFHAGETNWQGLDVDRNLIDALLLNSSRIGHGYALTKHPLVRKLMREKNIAVEVNPISNQVLNLVGDLRNHPATSLIASGYPVVISSDDPALWGATSLSHDFYETFMGIAGASADLTMIKQLIINSIRYSAMSDKEKCAALTMWNEKWRLFIKQTLPQSSCCYEKNHWRRNPLFWNV